MGSYKLWELASTREEIHVLAQQVAEDMAEKGHMFRKGEWDEPSQTLVYAVHQYLWQRKAKPDFTHPPFTHQVKGQMIVRVLRRLVPELDTLFSPNQASRLSRSVYSILSNNVLLLRAGGSGVSVFYIREWPQGFIPEWYRGNDGIYITHKDEVDIKRQEKRAVVLAGEVETSYDLSLIPLPDPNPDSVMDYIGKVLPMVKKLQKENERLRQELEIAQGKDWSEVTEKMKDLVDGE
jgi:hypothetical protein